MILDYTHLEISFENIIVNIPNEGTTHVHLKIIPYDNLVNVSNIVEITQVDLVKEALNTIKIISYKDISYTVTDARMRNYFLHENFQIIFISKEKEKKI